MNAGAAMVWASLLCAHVAALAANRRNTLPIECLWWLGCSLLVFGPETASLDKDRFRRDRWSALPHRETDGLKKIQL